MKILWLCNVPIPEISQKANIETTHLGGWLVGLCNSLVATENIELTYMFPYKTSISGVVGKMSFCGFSRTKAEATFEENIANFKPDIIHIFGTEYVHTLQMINTCEKLGVLNKTIIHIQGLVSIYEKHYYANLPLKTIYGFTIKELFAKKNVFKGKKSFQKRGFYEIQALQKCKNVIGRTDWDKACVEQINNECRYFFCNESLRDEFYKHSWSIENCEQHSLFVSQCSYPIKGFHLMLEAMPQILKKHPNTHLYTTGLNPTTIKWRNKYKLGTYKRYLAHLIKKYDLQNKVTFLGSLNDKQICNRFLKSHVFVSASSIENSSNSIGEAMLLGVPVVSSDVGGIKNLLTHEKEGYIYQHDAPYMLSYYVDKIFKDTEKTLEMSISAKSRAAETHNRESILKTTLEIYKSIYFENIT